ncbi:hypothetical protein VKT23_007288 [Stygiomarasmius scandens]|uniref:Uncharacterized protein n=1 Tax=Marasmiellus scandens TaxID=2682957 RepID=A0ABR1JKL6_9AGAR
MDFMNSHQRSPTLDPLRHTSMNEIHDEIANGGVWSIRKMERATLMVEQKTTSKRKQSGEILPSKKRRTGKQGTRDTGNEEEVVADVDEENSKPNRILYKIDERVPAKFLEIDQDLVLKITDDEPGDQRRLTPGVKVYDYREALTMILNSQYYRPKFPNQATFDSFIYDEGENTVTVFQVTIAPSHDVKLSNKAWWTSLRGANTSEPPKFDYVVVTTDAMVKLEVTRPAASFFRYFYHMRIPADDVFAKLSA